MKHYIYKITNLVDGNIYIGKHSSSDITRDRYLGSGVRLLYAVNKYGRQNFIRQILYQFQNESEALDKQKQIVDAAFLIRDDVYNLVQGGKSGWKLNNISVKDSEGNVFRVQKNDLRYQSGEVSHISKGRVVVKDQIGNTFQTSVTDSRYLAGQLLPINIGMVVVRDQFGRCIQVKVCEEKYLNKEYQHINKNKTVVKDSDNNVFQVYSDDCRIKCGQLVGINSGKITVKDSNGDTYQISNQDERWTSRTVRGCQFGKKVLKSLKTGKIKVFDKGQTVDPEYVGIMKNKIRAVDADDNVWVVETNDERIQKGELRIWSKGMVSVVDPQGHVLSVSINDPQYMSGELVSLNKGKILVTNKFGQNTTMYKNDQRYLSGEFFGITKGRKAIHNTGTREILFINEEDSIPDGWKPGTGEIFVVNRLTNERKKIKDWEQMPNGFQRGFKL